MLALLFACSLSAPGDATRRDVAKAVRRELQRLYMYQMFLGPYAPMMFMMGGHGLPFLNGMPMNMGMQQMMGMNKFPGFDKATNGEDEDDEYFDDDDDENADENIARRDVSKAVRKELQRMWMMSLMFSQMPQGNGQQAMNPMLPFMMLNSKNKMPFNTAAVNDEYDDDDADEEYYNDEYYSD